jgi:phage baseplate assembly protein W
LNYQDFSKKDIESNLYDTDAVKASIMNIVLTQRGSLPGFPEFGSDIYKYLFEPLTMFTKISLADNIESSIYKNDKRVKTVKVTAQNTDTYAVSLEIKFTTKNDSEPQIITVHLQG